MCNENNKSWNISDFVYNRNDAKEYQISSI